MACNMAMTDKERLVHEMLTRRQLPIKPGPLYPEGQHKIYRRQLPPPKLTEEINKKYIVHILDLPIRNEIHLNTITGPC